MDTQRHRLEIDCRACGTIALARAEPVHEGFRRVGERFVCTACGHRYPSRDETPFVDDKPAASVFSEADRQQAPQVFAESERRRCCAWCGHRVVNPFGQRCGLSNREIESTDLCDRFQLRAEPGPEKPSPPRAAADPLSRLFGE